MRMPSLSSSTRTGSPVLLILCVLLVIGQLTLTATAINPATYCAPGQAMKIRQCVARMKKCRAHGAIMKFSGQGCRNSRGKPVGDGGCQCSGYCAYSCSKPCVRDRQCYWNATAAACFIKATNTLGAPILTCLPSPSPTTARPSREPTMRTPMPTALPSSSPSSNPTMSPITTQPSRSPSASPATSEPSVAPSQTPSGTPTSAPSQTPSGIPSTSPTKGPVLVTCNFTIYEALRGIWLDDVYIGSSVTPRDVKSTNSWGISKNITFEVDPLSTSQTIVIRGQTLQIGYVDIGFTFICRSDLLVWTFQTSIYENWVGQNGDGPELETAQSSSLYCLNVAPYSEGCTESPNKYDIIKIRPDVVNGTVGRFQFIRKTIDSTTPNYMMNLGRLVLMPPTTGSRVILYSISNIKSFRITNTGTSGNLCIYNEPAGTVTRCYYGNSSGTLFFFAFSGTVAAGYDNNATTPGIVGTPLFSSVASTGILYLMDDENLCYSEHGELPPTPATSCLLFSSPAP